MTTRDHDTDPSTPGAKKAPGASSSALAPVGLEDEPGLKAARLRPTTDPGIAPPPEMLPIPDEPMGIVVPSVAPGIVVPSVAPNQNDSVDVLLDGMGSSPEHPKAGAQSQGQSAAAYHAEHALAPGRNEPAEEPKVVLARPILAETIKLERPAVSLPDADPKAWADTTAVMSQPVGPRVFIAVSAGILVVVGVFFALQRTSGLPGMGTPTAAATASGVLATTPAAGIGVGASAGAAANAGVGAPAAAANVGAGGGPGVGAGSPAGGTPAAAPPAAPAPAPETKPSAEAAPATSVSLADRPAATTHKSTSPPKTSPRTRAHPAPSSPKPSGADLGEFKGSF